MIYAGTYKAEKSTPFRTNPLRFINHMLEVKKQRRALSKMSDAQLRDIGVTYETAQREAARNFWDIA